MITARDPARMPGPLRALHETLTAERAALVANDADALVRLAETKLRNLRALTEAPASVREEFPDDLRALAGLNAANGALIARRRHETVWTLRQLGLYEGNTAYDARGGFGSSVRNRHWATA
ncbi:MAG TPA: flagellar protein FlgN [Rudaea sp.]